jgi:hypothetical protein
MTRNHGVLLNRPGSQEVRSSGAAEWDRDFPILLMAINRPPSMKISLQGEAWQGRAPARSGLARQMNIAKSKHPPIVREKGRRDVQRRIAQERVPTTDTLGKVRVISEKEH